MASQLSTRILSVLPSIPIVGFLTRQQLSSRFLLVILSLPLLPLILIRRLTRFLRKLPSQELCGPPEIGKPLEPNMHGLHKRFVELYGSSSAEAGKGEDSRDAHPEVAAVAMQKRLTLKDGQEIAYWDLGPSDATEVVLLCQGLGARIAGWTPLFDALCSRDGVGKVPWRKRRLIIPEYRGQFASIPLVGGSISVEQGAADFAAVVAALKIKKALVMCWSTGVQVALQLALDQPDLVTAMILIQGFDGKMASCCMQPVCAIPGMPSLFKFGLQQLPKYIRGSLRKSLYEFMLRNTDTLERISSAAMWVFGSDLMPSIGIRYGQDMIQSDAHFATYCKLAVALDQHDPSPRLGEIKVPVLVVTGTPDFVTPARCSYNIAAKLGGRVQLVDDFGASHYFLQEEPHKVAGHIAYFLNSIELAT